MLAPLSHAARFRVFLLLLHLQSTPAMTLDKSGSFTAKCPIRGSCSCSCKHHADPPASLTYLSSHSSMSQS